MTRHAGRAVMAVGVVVAIALSNVITYATLTSQRLPTSGDVAIAMLSTLGSAPATKIVAPLLAGLDQKARRERDVWNAPGGIHQRHVAALPIFLVRDGDDVHAFIALDPWTGCDLELAPISTSSLGTYRWLFHDACLGSLYDLAGNRAGGPAPWTLDQLAVTVRGDSVFAQAGMVVPGHLPP